jgi:hypothetical protein
MVMSNGSLFTGRSCVSKVEYRRQKINRQGRGATGWVVALFVKQELGGVVMVVGHFKGFAAEAQGRSVNAEAFGWGVNKKASLISQ